MVALWTYGLIVIGSIAIFMAWAGSMVRLRKRCPRRSYWYDAPLLLASGLALGSPMLGFLAGFRAYAVIASGGETAAGLPWAFVAGLLLLGMSKFLLMRAISFDPDDEAPIPRVKLRWRLYLIAITIWSGFVASFAAFGH